MAIFGAVSVVRAQTGGLAWFAPAFDYLDEVFRPDSAARRRLLGLAPGTSQRIELPNGMYAMEQAYVAKARADSIFESHRRYIDVQVIVAGEELMGVADIAKLTVTQPFDADRDVIIYGDYAPASVLRFTAGEAAIYFPVDGHMPSLRIGAEPTEVRKTVVKVPVPA